MDQRSLRILEYHSVIRLLEEQAVTDRGKELARLLLPLNDISAIKEVLQETSEARYLLRGYSGISFAGVHDVKSLLHRIEIGGLGEPSELQDLGDTLAAARKLKNTIAESDEDAPILKREAARIGLFQDIENTIDDSINDIGEIKDSASQELSGIRKQMRSLNERIRQKLDSYIRSSAYQKIIQEPIVTQREGRFVIPIRQESRGQFPGIIHDQSASGATLFIEPMAVVEANNDLRQLTKREQQEIERIIRMICTKIFSRIIQIKETVGIVSRLDFVFAKAKLSRNMDAVAPELSQSPSADFIQARHPLIGENVVPIDINIGKSFSTLVITGPNTGGKTVALKTLGLLILMAQSGLHIPVKYGSTLGVFNHVLADIGDEQSIEQSLSTFSGHMKNIIGMIDHIDKGTLALLDEIGAGTDPAEGAALAMAILEYLHRAGVKTVATTHYSELKAFAYNNGDVENASVEFDIETLRPTYRLTLGLPGHSNAFAIAGRLGLSDEIIESAKEKISKDTVRVDDMIRSVSNMMQQAELDQKEISRAKESVRKLEMDLLARQERMKSNEDEIIRKAKEEARSLVAKSKTEAEDLIRSLRKLLLNQSITNYEGDLREAEDRLSKMNANLNTFSAHIDDEEVLSIEEILPGMIVEVIKLRRNGEVIGLNEKKGIVEVKVGAMKLSVSAEELAKVNNPVDTIKDPISGPIRMSGESVSMQSTEIDVRGSTVEEALMLLEKHIDSALISNIPRIHIIHGKGTGALRTAIRDYLKDLPNIQSFRSGESGEGGDGVTVAYLQ